LQSAANPAVIPYLASDFSSDEPVKTDYGEPGNESEMGVTAPPRSLYSGTIALRIIDKAPQFSAPMKAWTKEAQKFRFRQPEAFRLMMRQWWKENKTFFEKRDYDSVTPVSIAAFEQKSQPAADPKQEQVPVVQELPAPRKIEAATPAPAPMPVMRVSPVESGSNWTLILCGVIIALMVGAFGFRMLRK
jgi:hypothetical protein